MRFFNKLRYKTIKTNGLRKYVVYAIGEIILVVIGILIALWINNWNQNRLENNRQELIAQTVLDQMKKDVQQIDLVLQKMDEQDLIYELLLMERNPTMDEKITLLKDAPFLATLDFTVLALEPKVLNQLTHTTITHPEFKEILSAIESDYISAEKTLSLSEEIIINELLNNLKYLRENYDWYHKFVRRGTLDVSEYSYFGSNDYRNRVAHMELIAMDSYYGDLLNYKTAFEEHIHTIEKVLYK